MSYIVRYARFVYLKFDCDLPRYHTFIKKLGSLMPGIKAIHKRDRSGDHPIDPPYNPSLVDKRHTLSAKSLYRAFSSFSQLGELALWKHVFHSFSDLFRICTSLPSLARLSLSHVSWLHLPECVPPFPWLAPQWQLRRVQVSECPNIWPLLWLWGCPGYTGRGWSPVLARSNLLRYTEQLQPIFDKAVTGDRIATIMFVCLEPRISRERAVAEKIGLPWTRTFPSCVYPKGHRKLMKCPVGPAVSVAFSEKGGAPPMINFPDIDRWTEYLFHLKRGNVVKETQDWVNRNQLPPDSGVDPAAMRLSWVGTLEVYSLIAREYDYYALLEVEERKPFDTHQAFIYYRCKTMETDAEWKLRDIVAAAALFRDIDFNLEAATVKETRYEDVLADQWTKRHSHEEVAFQSRVSFGQHDYVDRYLRQS